jgi:hypothetical protein
MAKGILIINYVKNVYINSSSTPSDLIYKQKLTKTFGLKYKQKLPKVTLLNAIIPKVPLINCLTFLHDCRISIILEGHFRNCNRNCT